jgi:hypothetical protein
MPEVQRVRVTVDFEVFAEEYLEAMQEVRIVMEHLQEIQDELFKEDLEHPRVLRYNIWAKGL